MSSVLKDESFYSPEELAQKFKLSLSSIYKLLRSGEIPAIRLGKVYRIAESELSRYLSGQKKGRAAQQAIPRSAETFLDLLKKSPLQKRVQEVYLYGSRARGDFDTDSDIDLCLILDRLDFKTRGVISSLAEKAMASTDYEDLLSIREESLDGWNRMKAAHYPLVQNILREGIPLWKNH